MNEFENNDIYSQSNAQQNQTAPVTQQPVQPAQTYGYTYTQGQTYYHAPQQPVAPVQPTYSYSGYQDYQQPVKKAKKSGSGWGVRIVSLLLAAVIGLGCGYVGTKLAAAKPTTTVIQRVETPTDATPTETSSTVGSGALTSKQIAKKAVPYVVAIRTEKMSTSNYWFGNQVVSGAGSGVIISEDGYIITNYHVVSGASTLIVELQDGTEYNGTVVGTYSNNDIAVVKIEATGLDAAKFADSDKVEQGDVIYAIGNPEGNYSGSITQGIISALNRSITVQLDNDTQSTNPFYQGSTKAVTLNVFQFDAAVSPGNSGGGLFNDRGELIGIVCAKSSDTDAEGLNFAIIGNRAFEIASSIISTGSFADEGGESGNMEPASTKAMLGITVTYLSSANAAQYGYRHEGVYVTDISLQSTEDAGLAIGDRIISIDDNVVSENDDLINYIAEKEPGDVITLTVERNNKILNIDITLVANPNAK